MNFLHADFPVLENGASVSGNTKGQCFLLLHMVSDFGDLPEHRQGAGGMDLVVKSAATVGDGQPGVSLVLLVGDTYNEFINNDQTFDTSNFNLYSDTCNPLPVVTVSLQRGNKHTATTVFGISCLWYIGATNIMINRQHTKHY